MKIKWATVLGIIATTSLVGCGAQQMTGEGSAEQSSLDVADKTAPMLADKMVYVLSSWSIGFDRIPRYTTSTIIMTRQGSAVLVDAKLPTGHVKGKIDPKLYHDLFAAILNSKTRISDGSEFPADGAVEKVQVISGAKSKDYYLRGKPLLKNQTVFVDPGAVRKAVFKIRAVLPKPLCPVLPSPFLVVTSDSSIVSDCPVPQPPVMPSPF